MRRRTARVRRARTVAAEWIGCSRPSPDMRPRPAHAVFRTARDCALTACARELQAGNMAAALAQADAADLLAVRHVRALSLVTR